MRESFHFSFLHLVSPLCLSYFCSRLSTSLMSSCRGLLDTDTPCLVLLHRLSQPRYQEWNGYKCVCKPGELTHNVLILEMTGLMLILPQCAQAAPPPAIHATHLSAAQTKNTTKYSRSAYAKTTLREHSGDSACLLARVRTPTGTERNASASLVSHDLHLISSHTSSKVA